MPNQPYLIAGAVAVLLLLIVPAVKIVQQYQKGVVFRFGKLVGERGPGLNIIIPYVDRLNKVDMRVETLVVEPQEVITRDNVTVQVDAVVYFQPVNATDTIVKVQNYAKATSQIAQTTLRSVLGQSDLDELLAHRDKINERLREIIDGQTEPWGVKASIVEVKDVLLPETLQRVMSRQAEAEREKRAKIIHAEGEQIASEALAKAGERLAAAPASLQLRYLQTLVEMAGEKNATILPIPLDIIRQFAQAVKS
ncbi:MAG: SPFH domain-containing protein [Chloroflexi bacterium]|nr:SPFH domain-containing protein [Chloroflexota bacterium]